MKAQEIIDIVWTHFVTKGRARSADKDECLYRGPRGTKCAVGVLLTDAEVKRLGGRNGESVFTLEDQGLLPKRLVPHSELLGDLQNAHDGWAADSGLGFRAHMRRRLRDIAENHDLRVPKAGAQKVTNE